MNGRDIVASGEGMTPLENGRTHVEDDISFARAVEGTHPRTHL
jgi:hypothetical protein